MLTYAFDRLDKTPLYEHLYRCIRGDILSGQLAPGEKLPSKRTLARHLEVAVVTVETAYAQLIAEGYVYAVEKKGYYVARVDTVPMPEVKSAVHREPQPQTSPAIDFLSNNVSASQFPFSVWARLLRETLSGEGEALLKASPANGLEVLRKAIAEHLYAFRGMHVDPSCIVIGAGTDYLYNLLLQLLGAEKRYAVEDPGYSKISSVYTAAGADFCFVGMDGSGVVPDQLRIAGADVVHLSPSHHFPSGIVTPIGRRQELLAWASEGPGRYIIEDDYDSEYRFSGRPIPTMQSIDSGGRVIYVNSFSKSLSPSFRISYMVLPPALAEAFRHKLGFYACTVPNIEQYTLAKFIAGGYFEQHLSRMKKYYRQLRNQLIAAINRSPLADRTVIREADAGLHFILAVQTVQTDAELVRRAEANGIRVACLSQYAHAEPEKYAHQLVINYSGADPEKLSESVSRLAEILD